MLHPTRCKIRNVMNPSQKRLNFRYGRLARNMYPNRIAVSPASPHQRIDGIQGTGPRSA